MSRSSQVAKNVLTGIIGQMVTMLLSFITRTVFIHTLSAAYLGVSGLFTSILTVLNLSELGIGVSITFALYKPISEKDNDTIKLLMSFYERSYKIIGFVVLIIGLAIMPFLDKLISGGSDLANVRIVFILYILETVASYWLFAYKRTLLEANQQKYIVTLYNTLTTLIISLLRIVVLLILKSNPEVAFYSYTIVGIAGQILNNILISRQVDKQFPFLKSRTGRKLSKEQITPIYKNIAGASISKISGIMLTSVDNILISAFINVSLVGVYSNYIALRTYVTKPISIIFESITASVGNYCATETKEKQEEFFHTIQFTYFWIYGFCSISLWILLNPFIGTVWINKDYLLSDTAVFLIVINFLLDGLSGAVIKFRDANGLYWQAKYRYLFSAVFNGIISYILVKVLGIEGVLLGTTASIIIMISLDPIIVYKNVFNKSAMSYYIRFFGYLLLVAGTGTLVTLIVCPFNEPTILNFCIKVLVCLLVPNGIWLAMFAKTKNMILLKKYASSIIVYAKKAITK